MLRLELCVFRPLSGALGLSTGLACSTQSIPGPAACRPVELYWKHMLACYLSLSAPWPPCSVKAVRLSQLIKSWQERLALDASLHKLRRTCRADGSSACHTAREHGGLPHGCWLRESPWFCFWASKSLLERRRRRRGRSFLPR